MAAALKRPGLIRAGLGFILGAGFGFGLVVALRAISGLEIFQTEPTGYPHLIVPAITGPLGFLIGPVNRVVRRGNLTAVEWDIAGPSRLL